MVFACQNAGIALILGHDGECAVAAYVVKPAHSILTIQKQEERETCGLISKIIAGTLEAGTMSYQNPLSGEDRSTLQIE